MKKRFMKIATAMLSILLLFQMTGCKNDPINKAEKTIEQKTECVGEDENFKISNADVLVSESSEGDEFSTLEFNLTLKNAEKYAHFLQDVGAPGDYAVHVFYLRERAPTKDDEDAATRTDEGDIIYGIYNYVGVVKNKQNKYERASVWAHKVLNAEYKDYAISFQPPQWDGAKQEIKKRIDYSDEEISALLAIFQEENLTFDHTVTETSKDIEYLKKPLGYTDNVLKIKADIDQNYYNEYALEYQYIYHDLSYTKKSGGCGGCNGAIDENITERIGTITTGFISVKGYLSAIANGENGTYELMQFCKNQEIYNQAIEVINGSHTLEISIDYLAQIGLTPFAEKKTAVVRVMTKGYNEEGNEYGAYYELNSTSVFDAIKEVDIGADPSSCLGAAFWEFEYLGKTKAGHPHYVTRYSRGASVTVTTAGGGIERAQYYLDLNQSYADWYRNAIPESTLTYTESDGFEKLDIQCNKMLEYFYNAMLKLNNCVATVTGGAENVYGFWGVAFVPYEKNITSSFQNMFNAVPVVGTGDVAVSLYSLPYTEWKIVNMEENAYERLKQIYNMDMDGAITNFLDETLSEAFWDQDVKKAYIIPFMMSGAGSGTIAFNGNINSVDTATETELLETLGFYKLQLENQSKLLSILSVALVAFIVVMIVDRIRDREYY